jgi:hypothetical protein
MLKCPNKLLLLALLGAIAATSTGSALAEEKRQDKKQPALAMTEHQDGDNKPGKGEKSGKEAGKFSVKTGVITVHNHGYGPLTITADPTITRISGTGSFVIVTPATGTPCGKSVVVPPRGGECTIGVQYTPKDTEISTARVTLTDSGAKNATQDTIIRAD